MERLIASICVIGTVCGCTYYSVAPDEARRFAVMPREQRDSATVPAVREMDGKVVGVHPARLRLVGQWHDGAPMRLRRPTVHPAMTTGIVLALVGLALLVPGAAILSGPSQNDAQSGSCDICAFSAGLGSSLAGGALVGLGAVHLFGGGIAIVVGATRPDRD